MLVLQSSCWQLLEAMLPMAYLECCKGVVVGVQHQPYCAEMAPAKLLQHHIATLLELLTQLDWMVTTCR